MVEFFKTLMYQPLIEPFFLLVDPELLTTEEVGVVFFCKIFLFAKLSTM